MSKTLMPRSDHELMDWAVFTLKDGWSICRCGAHWSLKAGSTAQDVTSLFQSHVRYFNNKTLVL